jgi:hypothetical protein
MEERKEENECTKGTKKLKKGSKGTVGRAMAQAVSHWLSTAAARVRARVSHLGFVGDKVTLGQVFSEYFSFPCQSLFHQLLHNHHQLSSGAGTVGQ